MSRERSEQARPRTSNCRGWFVAGTDTEVGKTRVAAGLLRTLARNGHRCVGMKPVASGCAMTPAGLRSEDAEILQANSSGAVAYEDVNPYGFGPAVAPHLAARAIGAEIDLGRIGACFERLCAKADWVVVEGVGGWLVPLGDDRTMADLARLLGLPVILVVGVRLGCLNHALLTVKAIANANLKLTGWVANRIEPAVELFEENVATLQGRIRAPLLGVCPYVEGGLTAEISGKHLDLSELLTQADTNVSKLAND